MGGCYESSRSSYVAPPRRDNVRSSLDAFFSTHDRTKLVAACREHEHENASGFIKQLLTYRGCTEAPKEFPEIEYEVKLAIEPKGFEPDPSIKQYLDSFEFPPTGAARFLKDPVNAIAEGVNHFFGEGLEEHLVLIEKGGKMYLKEKSQPLPLDTGVPYEHLVMKRTELRCAASMDEVLTKVAGLKKDVDYVGALRKEKGDAFILDTTDGRIYSFTVTRAHAPGRIQRQLEIEYAGFVPGFLGFEKENETQIVAGMVELAKHVVVLHQNAPIANGVTMQLKPTDERKYDFVRNATPLLDARK